MTIFVHTVQKGVNSSNYIGEERVREILKRADRDGDGRLSKEELKQAFRQLGSHVTDWRVFRCLRHVDTDKDGLISASEFDALVKYAVSKYGYK